MKDPRTLKSVPGGGVGDAMVLHLTVVVLAPPDGRMGKKKETGSPRDRNPPGPCQNEKVARVVHRQAPQMEIRGVRWGVGFGRQHLIGKTEMSEKKKTITPRRQGQADATHIDFQERRRGRPKDDENGKKGPQAPGARALIRGATSGGL